MLIVVYSSLKLSSDAFLRDSAEGQVNARLRNPSFLQAGTGVAPYLPPKISRRAHAFSKNIYKIATVFYSAPPTDFNAAA